jgi:hypothetical protein
VRAFLIIALIDELNDGTVKTRARDRHIGMGLREIKGKKKESNSEVAELV